MSKFLLLVLGLVLIGSYLFYSYEWANKDMNAREKVKLEKAQLELKDKTNQLNIMIYAYDKLPSDGKNSELLNKVQNNFQFVTISPNLTAILLGKGK